MPERALRGAFSFRAAKRVAADRWSAGISELDRRDAPVHFCLCRAAVVAPASATRAPRSRHHPATSQAPNTPTRPGRGDAPVGASPPWARPYPPRSATGTVSCAIHARSGTSSSCSRCTPAWSALADPRKRTDPRSVPAIAPWAPMAPMAPVVPAAGRLLPDAGPPPAISVPARTVPTTPATPRR